MRYTIEAGKVRVQLASVALLLALVAACGGAEPSERGDGAPAAGGEPAGARDAQATPRVGRPSGRGARLPESPVRQDDSRVERVRRVPADPHYFEVMDIAAGSETQGSDIDSFWRAEFDKLGAGVGYRSPSATEPYYPVEGLEPETACVPANADPRTLANNAFYCPEDQKIEWDEAFLWGQYERYGDMAPVSIIAHEWGHHIQRLTGYPPFSLQAELQADCYAGLYTKSAEDRGMLEEGDVQEAMYSLYDAGNPAFDEAAWFAEGEHGKPEERATAYLTGYRTGDPANCLAYKQYKRGEILELGTYLLAVAPGTRIERGEKGAYRLESRLGLAGIRYIPDLPAERAVEVLAERAEQTVGEGARLIGAPREVEVDPTTGTDAVQRYEQVGTTRDGSPQAVHGILFLQVDAQGGGYVVDTYLPGPAPEDEAGWEPSLQYLRTLLAGIKRAEGAR